LEQLLASCNGLEHYLEYIAQSSVLGVWATGLARPDPGNGSLNSNSKPGLARHDEQIQSLPISLGIESLESDFAGHSSADIGDPKWGFGTSGVILPALCLVATIATVVAILIVSSRSTPIDRDFGEVAHAAGKSPEVGVKTGGVSSVRVDSGTVDLKLPGIGHVIVEGPAQFDMLSAKRARLSGGRIKMRVTEETGHGFVVETPYGEVTDLGTEFGIDLTEQGQAGLVVFEGSVDLRVAESAALESARVERLVGGEGVIFNKGGPIDRIASIVTGSVPTFVQSKSNTRDAGSNIFRSVFDNSKNSKKFYEIVPRGLHEDVQLHVDRPHQWNGLTEAGIPPYLVGADYVKTFSRDGAEQQLEIFVTIGCPSTLYVMFDDEVPAPGWLRKNFKNTGDKIGADCAAWGKKRNRRLGIGPGKSIDGVFAVWKRDVHEPETIVLGANEGVVKGSGVGGMYGIAAVATEESKTMVTVDSTTN
jgi:hypothetical protein